MMDFDATQAIDLSDFEDDTQDESEGKTALGYLKVFSNRGFQEKVYPVFEGENFIGRDDANQITIPVKSLSKQHACIEVHADTHLIYDLGSRNKCRKGKLFLKPNVRYNMQHDDKFILADMACQYYLASEYNKSQGSGSDTDSELMLDGVDSDQGLLIPHTEDQKESENSDYLNLSDCIQPTQAVKSDHVGKNKTLQMKTPAVPRAGGVLARESDEEIAEDKGTADVSRVLDSGSEADVEPDLDDTDNTEDADDLAMAATQAVGFIQDPPTQPTSKVRATLTYDPDSDSESGKDGEGEERRLFEAETQAVPSAVSDSEDGDDKSTGLYEAETQAVPVVSEDDDDEDRSSVYELATQAVEMDDSDTERRNEKRVSIASTVLLNQSSDLESSAKKPRESFSPTKQALMLSTKKTPGRNDTMDSFIFNGSSTKKKLKDVAFDTLDSEDTDLDESSTQAEAPFQNEPTEDTLPCTDMDDTPQEEREDQSNLSKEDQLVSKDKEDSITDEETADNIPENIPEKSHEDGKPENLKLDLVRRGTEGFIPSNFDANSQENKMDVKKDDSGNDIGSREISMDTAGGSEEMEEVRVTNGAGKEQSVYPTLHYNLHRSQSDKSTESSLEAMPTVPYQLVKGLTNSSTESKGDPVETVVCPIETDTLGGNNSNEGQSIDVEGGDKEVGNDNTDETQAYGMESQGVSTKSSRKRRTATIDRPNIEFLTTPEREQAERDLTEADSPLRKSRRSSTRERIVETVEEDDSNNGMRKPSSRSALEIIGGNNSNEGQSIDVEGGHVGNDDTEETQAYGMDDADSSRTVDEVEKGHDKDCGTAGKVTMDTDATQRYGDDETMDTEECAKINDGGDEPVAMETEETQAYGDEHADTGETQVYGDDSCDKQVPDSQEAGPSTDSKYNLIQTDNVFAEPDPVQSRDEGNQVETDAAPQRRKSGDEGLLKRGKSSQSLKSLDSSKKGGLLSSLKKKVRFGRKSSSSQSESISVTSSTRSSSRSSRSSTGSGDGELDAAEVNDLSWEGEDQVEETSPLTFKNNLETEEREGEDDEDEAGEERPVKVKRKRKLATVDKPDEERVKAMKTKVEDEEAREKGEMDKIDTEKPEGGKGVSTKSSRKRRTATVDRPNIEFLTTPEREEAERDLTEADSPLRKSRRSSTRERIVETVEEDDSNNDMRKPSSRSKVKEAEVAVTGVVVADGNNSGVRGRRTRGRGRGQVTDEGGSEKVLSQSGSDQESKLKTGEDVTSERQGEDGSDEREQRLVERLEDKSETRGRSTRNTRGGGRGNGKGGIKEERSIAGKGTGRNDTEGEDPLPVRTSKRMKSKAAASEEREEKVLVDEKGSRSSTRSKRSQLTNQEEEEEVKKRLAEEEKDVDVRETSNRVLRKGNSDRTTAASDTPKSTRSRSKKQELDKSVNVAPTTSRSTRSRGGSKGPKVEEITKEPSSAPKRGRRKDRDEESNSSTLSLDLTLNLDEKEDITSLQPTSLGSSRRERRSDSPVVKVVDASPNAADADSQGSVGSTILRKGRRKGARNASEITSTPTSTSKTSNRKAGRSTSKNPKVTVDKLEVGSSPSLRRRSSESRPKVMFTGVIDKSGEKVVTSLGGELVESVFDCTHLVTDKVRRTVKFLCCLSQGTLIVTPEWLERSKQQQTFVDAEEFILIDKDAEKQHQFKLLGSHEKAREGALLTGWKVHTTASVKPEPAHMKDIIRSAGGEILARVPCQQQERTVVISCQEDSAKCLPAVAADIPILTAEFLLTGLLRQEIDTESYRLPIRVAADSSTPGKKSKSSARSRRR
ncbi:uncharacterized protein [Apostichopus japonicus]|uniref:uncharacterized protein isoform X2 n=1 Tax=Stichopus japonicus TaxID=307972 RepID=UPI003AB32FFD